MADWHAGDREEDLRPRMAALARQGPAFALATIAAADGGPRPVGSQMAVTTDGRWGFLSGGCIEDDVALHARKALTDGEPRRLVYGRGSPFVDMRLPCGGRLEVLVERIGSDDPALGALLELTAARRPARWLSDGQHRRCGDARAIRRDPADIVDVVFRPVQRLVVVGSDPFALAMADLGHRMGWDAILVAPFGPERPPLDAGYSREPVARALAATAPDPWTAVALATHDMDLDDEALARALATEAGYVGVLGARRRLPERFARLRATGMGEDAIGRVHAPIGLPLGAEGPTEVAIAVVAEILRERGANSEAIDVDADDRRTRRVVVGGHERVSTPRTREVA